MQKDSTLKWILKNVGAALGLVVVLVIGSMLALRCSTHHNEKISVPDFSGMSISEAKSLAKRTDVQVLVTDSIYVNRMQRGVIVRQNPEAGSSVKSGRKIRLTINSVIPKKIPMPNLVGYSLRSAKAELDSRGLTLGRLIYVNDMATNNVLKQLYRNSEVAPGTMVVSESKIDLMLGLHPADNVTSVPDVTGMTFRRAKDLIQENYLNMGTVRFDKEIRNYKDSLNAVVYRQSPEPSETTMGRTVSIYLTLDENKLSKK